MTIPTSSPLASVFTLPLLPALFSVLLLSACGPVDEAPTEEVAPLTLSYNGDYALQVDALLAPSPPTTGDFDLSLELQVEGEPLEGAEVTLELFMPGHGHGSAEEPLVIEEGAGLYRVENAAFSMPGLWELRLNVVWDEFDAHIVWQVDVDG
ncbi:FixH family protein [Lujinxingia vulgaris]|uniref:FixH family protein n=1 Tax=Lujinxingia vulgaris TaxID=2600176 RepID=A0A5C6XEY0_9DELT|nr:FixH family protein [Lujinxingia vulgaris]TXD35682.1 FixH family protein [Lujinxingia vulgaris]